MVLVEFMKNLVVYIRKSLINLSSDVCDHLSLFLSLILLVCFPTFYSTFLVCRLHFLGRFESFAGYCFLFTISHLLKLILSSLSLFFSTYSHFPHPMVISLWIYFHLPFSSLPSTLILPYFSPPVILLLPFTEKFQASFSPSLFRCYCRCHCRSSRFRFPHSDVILGLRYKYKNPCTTFSYKKILVKS